MNEPVVFSWRVSRGNQLAVAMLYVLRAILPLFLGCNMLCALAGGLLISGCGIPYGEAFGIALLVFLTGTLGLLAGVPWLKARKRWEYIPEEYAWTIDFDKKTLQEASVASTVETSFRRVKRCGKFLGYVALECSPAEMYFIPCEAFPSGELIPRLIATVRESMRTGGAGRIQVIPPSVIPPAKRSMGWKKGCLIGCGAILGLLALFAAAVGYGVYRHFKSPELVDIRLPAEQLAELSAAFTRLDGALKVHAPGLMARRKPMDPEVILRLQDSLQGRSIDALSMWYVFFSGMEGCELVPGGMLAGVDFAVDIRKLNDTALIRLTAPFRGQSMMLMHDSAGDGYFLGVTPERHFVYWDMLETPDMDSLPMGSLASFVNLIAGSIEQRLWTYDADGKIIASGRAAAEFMDKAEKNASTR